MVLLTNCLLVVIVCVCVAPRLVTASDTSAEHQAKQGDDISPSISIDSIPSASHRSLKDEAEAVSVSLSQASHLVPLHDDNYDSFVRNVSRLSVVLFYAPWSRRSLQFISDFSDASDSFSGSDEIAFGIVNCPNNKKLCKHARVTHFPHLRVVVRGNVDHFHVYSSHHETSKEIVKYIEHVRATDRRRAARDKKIADEEAAKPIEMFHPTPGVPYPLDPEEFENYTQSTQLLAMVLFHAPWCEACKGMHETMLDVADYFKTDKKVMIGTIDCERYQMFCVGKGVEGYPTLMSYAKPILAKGGSRYMGERSSADIKNYLDLQNFYHHSEDLVRIKAQFDKYAGMSESERPEDPTEMGGIFGTFGPMKPKDTEAKPDRIGKDPRKLL